MHRSIVSVFAVGSGRQNLLDGESCFLSSGVSTARRNRTKSYRKTTFAHDGVNSASIDFQKRIDEKVIRSFRGSWERYPEVRPDGSPRQRPMAAFVPLQILRSKPTSLAHQFFYCTFSERDTGHFQSIGVGLLINML
jgi:hypothetical protein